MTDASRAAVRTRARSAAYWTTTLIIAAESALGGVWDIMRTDYVRDVIGEGLSFPLYVAVIIGVCKIPAAMVLVLPRFPRLKEWVYAGVAFIYLGAVTSHLAVGDPAAASGPLGFLAITMASWALRPASRRDPAPDSWRPGRPFRGKVALYWAATGIIVAVLLTGGGADLIRREPTVDGMVALGYPVYFMTFLGTAKVLGAIALSAPRFGRLKEWAYAGAFYNFAGAFTSHLIMGSEAGHVFWTGLFSVLTLVSWALRPSGRVLGFAGAASDTGLRSSSRGASRRPVAPR